MKTSCAFFDEVISMPGQGDLSPPPFWLTALQALGTWTVALIALFGSKFWAWWHRPRLRVELVNRAGDLESETVSWLEPASSGSGPILKERTRHARLYRL